MALSAGLRIGLPGRLRTGYPVTQLASGCVTGQVAHRYGTYTSGFLCILVPIIVYLFILVFYACILVYTHVGRSVGQVGSSVGQVGRSVNLFKKPHVALVK